MRDKKATTVSDARQSNRRLAAPTLVFYLAQQLAVYLLLTALVLGAFAYLMDVLETLRQLGGKDIGAGIVMSKSLLKLPSLLLQMLPFAVLLATLITLQQLNRSHELIALRAAGLPARRFLLGPLLVVLATGLAALLILDPLSASLLKSYERWHGNVLPGSTHGLVTAGGSLWLKQHERDYDFFIFGKKIDPSARLLEDATVYVFNRDGSFKSRFDTPSMTLSAGQWRLASSTLVGPENTISRQGPVILPTSLTPNVIQSSFNPPGTQSFWELRHFLHVLKHTGFPGEQHMMAYQRLLALPALLLAMFWLAVPFALRYVRQGGLGLALGAGLGMGFGFFLFSNTMATFGLAGRLNIVVAAWLPTLIAALVAMALLIQLREE